MDARIAPPFMEATDASRLVCVVVVSYQEYSLTHTHVGLVVWRSDRNRWLQKALPAEKKEDRPTQTRGMGEEDVSE